MRSVKLNHKGLPGNLTEDEFVQLTILLREEGYNVLHPAPGLIVRWTARLKPNHVEFETALWYTIAHILWERKASELVAQGFVRHDSEPVIFSKDETVVLLARQLGSLEWNIKASYLRESSWGVYDGT